MSEFNDPMSVFNANTEVAPQISEETKKKIKSLWKATPTLKKYPEPPKPAETLSKEAWERMEGKARWDSIVALRGPDLTGSEALKWFTSSVIRHRLSSVMRVGGLINSQLGFVVLPIGCCMASPDSRFDLSHFLNHVHEAAAWLGVPVVWTSEENYKILLSSTGWSSRTIFMKKIYAELKDENLKARVRALLGIVEEEAL